VLASQIRAVASSEPVTTRSPSGLKAAEIDPACVSFKLLPFSSGTGSATALRIARLRLPVLPQIGGPDEPEML